MKTKEYLAGTLLVILLICSNIYSYIRYQKIHKIQSFLYELKKESDIKIGHLESLKECRHYEMLLNGEKITDQLNITDIKRNKKKLSDIASNHTLILRYSEMNCDVCVDSIIKKLYMYKDSIGLQNIVLLTSAKSPNYLKRFKKINKVHFDIYNLDRLSDSLLIDIGIPYLFVYSIENKRINNLFIPQKETPQLTDEYLHSILLKYYKI